MFEEYYFETEDIEEIILGMARIVYENRRLKRELAEAIEYKEKYENLLNANLKEARERSANLLSAIMAGAFTNNTEGSNRNEKP